jgi:hypothetical protein
MNDNEPKTLQMHAPGYWRVLVSAAIIVGLIVLAGKTKQEWLSWLAIIAFIVWCVLTTRWSMRNNSGPGLYGGSWNAFKRLGLLLAGVFVVCWLFGLSK